MEQLAERRLALAGHVDLDGRDRGARAAFGDVENDRPRQTLLDLLRQAQRRIPRRDGDEREGARGGIGLTLELVERSRQAAQRASAAEGNRIDARGLRRTRFDQHDALPIVELPEIERDRRAGVAGPGAARQRLRLVNVAEGRVGDGGNRFGPRAVVVDVNLALALTKHGADDEKVRREHERFARGIVTGAQRLAEHVLDAPDVIGVHARPVFGGGEFFEEVRAAHEGNRRQADRLPVARRKREDPAVARSARPVDEAHARFRAAQHREDAEQLGRVVVAGEHDDRRYLRQLVEHLDAQAHVVEGGRGRVEEVAGVNDEIGPELARDRDRLGVDFFVVGPARLVVGGAAEVPVGGVQQTHQRTPCVVRQTATLDGALPAGVV